METTAQTPSAAPTPNPHPLRLTERAIAQVKEIIRAQGFDGYYFSVRVTPAGCSGLGYDLNLVKEAKPGDILWEQDGVRIATDPLSRKMIEGTEVDYVSTVQGAGFKFSNPNAKASCGCGTSFTV